MILADALTAVSGSVGGKRHRFRLPLYDSYCFHRLPPTVEHLLAPSEAPQAPALPAAVWQQLQPPYDQVVLLFVDAFGWQFFQKYASSLPFLQRFLNQGLAVPLTAQFPSTTACHVTCMHMGQPVGQSGVYEWHYYEPIVDEVIGPLTFSIAGHRREGLVARGFTPAQVLPHGPTLYERLAMRGVDSFLYQSVAYTESSFTQHVGRGATLVGFTDLVHALALLREELMRPGSRPRYHVLYLDRIDAASHLAGPQSLSVSRAVQQTFTALEDFLHEPLAGKTQNSLMMLTADHGHTHIDPATTVVINDAIPDLESMLRTTREGRPIRFAGSPRDLFLHVKEEFLSQVEVQLVEVLGERAEVWRTADLVAQGVFGHVTPRLSERLGNLVILPYEGESVYWQDGDFAIRPYLGHHGGLTPNEMDTGVYFLEL